MPAAKFSEQRGILLLSNLLYS